jgi:hypothetical protein
MFMQTLHKGNEMKKRFLSFIAGGFLFLGINLNAFTYNIVNGDQMLGAVENITLYSIWGSWSKSILFF